MVFGFIISNSRPKLSGKPRKGQQKSSPPPEVDDAADEPQRATNRVGRENSKATLCVRDAAGASETHLSSGVRPSSVQAEAARSHLRPRMPQSGKRVQPRSEVVQNYQTVTPHSLFSISSRNFSQSCNFHICRCVTTCSRDESVITK